MKYEEVAVIQSELRAPPSEDMAAGRAQPGDGGGGGL